MIAAIPEYMWKDRDEDVQGKIKARGEPGDHIIAVLQLRSTPNDQFPTDRGGLGIEINREQMAELAEWFLNVLREYARGQAEEHG